MRTSLRCLFTLLVLLAVAVPAAADVNPALIQQVGNTWYVTPANDINVDGDDINAVLGWANPGDTIVLKAGQFVLGKPGSYTLVVDLPIPGWVPFTYNIGSQPFPVTKKLTIRGEVDTLGGLLTTITTNHGGATSPFSTMMPGIVIQELRFYRTRQAVRMWSAGTTVKKCIFEETLGTAVYAFPDLRTVYPHYVPPVGNGNPAADPATQFDFSDPVKTYMIDNRFVQCETGLQGFPSEMIVSGNSFGCRNLSLYLTPGWKTNLGGLPFAGGICQNNLIRNNSFSGQTVHTINVCPAAYWTGILRNNEVSHNLFTDVFHGVEFYAYSNFGPSIVTGNTVAHNRFATDKGCTLVASYWPTHENFLVSNNLFQKLGRWVVLFWATKGSAIVGNNMQNVELQWLSPDEAHIGLDTCERTTVVGESKKLTVFEIDGIDNVFVGVNNKKGVTRVGQRICNLMSDPEMKGWGPGQQPDVP